MNEHERRAALDELRAQESADQRSVDRHVAGLVEQLGAWNLRDQAHTVAQQLSEGELVELLVLAALLVDELGQRQRRWL